MMKSNGKKGNGKKGNGKVLGHVGRPRENKKFWKSVLRLPEKTAKRLVKAAKAEEISINSAIETVIEVWLRETNY